MNVAKNSLIAIHIIEILEENAAKDRTMSQARLMELLKEPPYEHDVTRNTLAGYINALRSENRIAGKRGIYKPCYFDDHELRLLIDGVLFGQHIPTEMAKELIEKLKKMSGQGLKNRIRHVHYLPDLNRTENKNLYEMIDKIDEAIQMQRRIRVTRCKYNEAKQLVKTDNDYVLDPYYLVTVKSRYYLICRMTRNGKLNEKLVNLRVDRFLTVDILSDQKALDIKECGEYRNGNFQLDEYMKQHVYMMAGDTVHAEMIIKKDHIEDFIDWYGKDFRVMASNEETVTIRFTVNDNAFKFWALQYCRIATVIKPQSLVDKIREDISLLDQMYGKEQDER
jgi:hypothetical protein